VEGREEIEIDTKVRKCDSMTNRLRSQLAVRTRAIYHQTKSKTKKEKTQTKKMEEPVCAEL